MDIFSREKRSEIMSRIRGKWTKQEKEFAEKNPDAIPHPRFPFSPDFLLGGKALFLDSRFWHGYVKASKYYSMSEFWQEKLFRNIMRDLAADSFYGGLSSRIMND